MTAVLPDALQVRLKRGFAEAFGGHPQGTVRAPGRVNLIGDHTDYNDGFVFPAAIDLETRIAWRAREDGRINAVAIDLGGETDSFAVTGRPVRVGGWRDYVRGSLAAMQNQAWNVAGADLAIAGSIPHGSGLSSSASLEVATIEALCAACGTPPRSAQSVAQLAQAAEIDFVGVKCGIMDQLAITAGKAGHALLIDCRSLAINRVLIPDKAALLIVTSGVERGLVDGEYNTRRRECDDAARIMGKTSLRDVDAEMLAACRAMLVPVLYRRASHVVSENQRVLAFVSALQNGDLAHVGRLMAQSHASLRDLFEVGHPKVDELVDLIEGELSGSGGARMTGGGFGGAVVALMPTTELARVMMVVRERYRTPQGTQPIIFEARPAGGVSRIE